MPSTSRCAPASSPTKQAWSMLSLLIEFLGTAWKEPDEGIWEVRGPRRHFTHSKVMAWVAFDRAIKMADQLRLPGTGRAVVRRCATRSMPTSARAASTPRATRSRSTTAGPSSTPACCWFRWSASCHPRIRGCVGTTAAIERELMEGGLVRRYRTAPAPAVDGLPPGEGRVPAVHVLAVRQLCGGGAHGRGARPVRAPAGAAQRCRPARRGVRSRSRKRLLGNFPQAFSHVSLINTALNLTRAHGPAHDRRLGVAVNAGRRPPPSG